MVDRGRLFRAAVARPKATTLVALYAFVGGLCAYGLAAGP
jgi:hypothetical protein